jgi:thioredoxin 1
LKILKFQADWCEPCKALTKLIEEIDTKIEIEVIDIDKEPLTTTKYGIRGVPTLVKIDENGIVDRITGYKNKKQIEDFING